MTMTPTAPHGEYGISTVVSGITIENESIVPTPIAEPVPDQKNATASCHKVNFMTILHHSRSSCRFPCFYPLARMKFGVV